MILSTLCGCVVIVARIVNERMKPREEFRGMDGTRKLAAKSHGELRRKKTFHRACNEAASILSCLVYPL